MSKNNTNAPPEVDEMYPEPYESAEPLSMQQEQELLKLLDMLSSETEEPSEEDMVSEPTESGDSALEERCRESIIL